MPIGLGGHYIGAAGRAPSGQDSTEGYERRLTQEGADKSRRAPRSDSQEGVKHEMDVEQLGLCSIEGGVKWTLAGWLARPRKAPAGLRNTK